MSLEEAKFWFMVSFQLINALASSGLWLYVRYGDRNKEVDRKFESLREDMAKKVGELRKEADQRMDMQDKTIARLSGLAERAPTHADLAALHEKANITAQSVSSIAGEMKGMGETLRLILNRIAEKGMK